MSSLRLLATFVLPLVIITTAPVTPFAQSEQYNGRYLVPKEGLIRRLTVAEAETHRITPNGVRSEDLPPLEKPFGRMDKQWEKLKAEMQPGDELWEFAGPVHGGVALIRNGEVVDAIMTWIR